jgi:hypothetical protein
MASNDVMPVDCGDAFIDRKTTRCHRALALVARKAD